jgi:hypothetical protein
MNFDNQDWSYSRVTLSAAKGLSTDKEMLRFAQHDDPYRFRLLKFIIVAEFL